MRRINRGYGARDSGFAKDESRSPAPRSRITNHESRITVSPWRVGQSVIHPSFGAGVIVSAEGRGPDARVQVNFRSGGLKWLMLEYAKLLPA